ncbi:hypothetical protein FBU30_000507, partial [Linnemannia zychae]
MSLSSRPSKDYSTFPDVPVPEPTPSNNVELGPKSSVSTTPSLTTNINSERIRTSADSLDLSASPTPTIMPSITDIEDGDYPSAIISPSLITVDPISLTVIPTVTTLSTITIPYTTTTPSTIDFQPGLPTTFSMPNGAISTNAAEIPVRVILGSMSGIVFAFAFLGALVIGLVIGFLLAKCTRLGGSANRFRKQQKDELTEQLRLLTDTLSHRTMGDIHERYFDNSQAARTFQYDRSYLNDEKHTYVPEESRQLETIPLYFYNDHVRQSVVSATTAPQGDIETERLNRYSIPSQSLHHWDHANSDAPITSPIYRTAPGISASVKARRPILSNPFQTGGRETRAVRLPVQPNLAVNVPESKELGELSPAF